MSVFGLLDNFLLDGVSSGGGSGGAIVPSFFGDGAFGVFNSAGDTTFSGPNGAYVNSRGYTGFKLNAGHTLTTNLPCQGLIIYCTGKVEVAGTISMVGKGHYTSEPPLIALLPFFEQWNRILGRDINLRGGNGGSGGTGYAGGAGSVGAVGRILAGGFGGGGGGGGSSAGFGGSAAPRFVDGIITNAGVGSAAYSTGAHHSTAGGGSNGRGGSSANPGYGGGGGAFNNTGGRSGYFFGGGSGGGGCGVGSSGGVGQNSGYAGGLVVIVAEDIEIKSGGSIDVSGGSGGSGGSGSLGGGNTLASGGGGGGGGAGGGVIVLAYSGTYINNGVLRANGGIGGSAGSGYGPGGQAGGGPGNSGSSGSVGRIIPIKI